MASVQQLVSLLLAVLLVGSSLAQTFQYSRGWTNGKRSVPCQLQRLRAILEGKAPDSAYLLCELSRVPEDELKLEHLPRPRLPEELAEK